MKHQLVDFSAGRDAGLKGDGRSDSDAMNRSNSYFVEGRTLRAAMGAVRRSWLRLLAWTIICVSAALVYVLLATPQFVATTQVVLEPRQPAIPTDPASSITAPTLDSAQADSEVQVLQSERNLRYVFNTLNLASDVDFSDNGFSFMGWLQSHLLSRFISPPLLSPEDQAAHDRDVAYQDFSGRVTVKRLAQSYAFEVSFRALSARKAAILVNSITAAYIRDQVIYNVAAAAAQRGGDYLQNRISDSKAEVDVATDAVRTGVIPNFVFGHADSRIVSAATIPLTKTYPMTTLILVLSLVFAIVTGFGVVVARNGLDRKVRSREQIGDLTGIEAIAVIPRGRRRRGEGSPTLSESIDHPFSPLAKAMRALRVYVLATENTSRYLSIGVVSCRGGEGKSLIAANLAHLIAASQQAVTLIDADVQTASLSAALAPTALVSLSELAASKGVDLSVVEKQLDQYLSFVPARSINGSTNPNIFVGSRETLQAIGTLAESQYVVIDLPNMAESAEAIAFGRSLSGVIVIAAAGITTVDELMQLVKTLTANSVQVIGVVINKATVR